MPHGTLEMVLSLVNNEARKEDDGRVWRVVTYESDSLPKIVIRYFGYDDEEDWWGRSVVSYGGLVKLGNSPRPCLMDE